MSISLNGTTGLTFADASSQNTAATGFGFKNRIINGAMMIDQRNAGASVTPTDGQYCLDRWKAGASASSKFSVQQSTTAPAGFGFSMLCTSLSAYSVGTNDNFEMYQSIEGFNTADLAWGTADAQAITISFKVRSSLTGTFGGSVTNSAFNRSYPFTYTISSANTWETKTVTIAGDTSGTWVGATNGTGIVVCFGLGAGSGRSGTAGSWASATYYNATGATSLVGTSGATLYITGVQLEKGSTATSFDYRPYGTELALCQRYYQTIDATGVVFFRWSAGYANTSMAGYNLPVQMRTSPTFSNSSMTGKNLYNMALDSNASSGTPTFSLNNSSATTAQIFGGDSDSSLGGNAGNPLIVSTTGATFNFSAEL